MGTIYKPNGDIKARAKLMEEFTIPLLEKHRSDWVEAKKIEYGINELIDGDPIYAGDEVTIIGYQQVVNPEYDFDGWIESVTITPAVYDADGITVITPEVITKNHPYDPPLYKDTDLQAYLDTLPEYAEYKKKVINESIDKLTVKTSMGNIFDASKQARQDMADAILASGYAGVTETIWRLADNTEKLVALDELREAHLLSLQAYAAAKGIGA